MLQMIVHGLERPKTIGIRLPMLTERNLPRERKHKTHIKCSLEKILINCAIFQQIAKKLKLLIYCCDCITSTKNWTNSKMRTAALYALFCICQFSIWRQILNSIFVINIYKIHCIILSTLAFHSFITHISLESRVSVWWISECFHLEQLLTAQYT